MAKLGQRATKRRGARGERSAWDNCGTLNEGAFEGWGGGRAIRGTAVRALCVLLEALAVGERPYMAEARHLEIDEVRMACEHGVATEAVLGWYGGTSAGRGGERRGRGKGCR